MTDRSLCKFNRRGRLRGPGPEAEPIKTPTATPEAHHQPLGHEANGHEAHSDAHAPRHVAIIQAAETSRSEQAEVADIAPVPLSFAVTDLKSANWVVRKIIEARAYSHAVQEWAEAETARAKREEEFFLMQFGSGLQQVLAEEIERQKGRRKSLKLPAGTIGFRAESLRVRVEREDAVLCWAKTHLPDAVRTTERISRTTINEHFAATEEVPDGCTVQLAQQRFFVR